MALHPNVPTILSEVVDELHFQDAPRLADGTGAQFRPLADTMGGIALAMAETSNVTHAAVVTLSLLQVLAETDPKELRFELVKLAALSVGWINDIDQRRP